MSKPVPETPSFADWQKAAAKAAGSPDKLTWRTPEGIDVKALYTAADLEGLPDADTLPGFAPFVRGPQATMYTVPGRSGSTRASPRPRNRTPSTGATSPPASRASRSRSTSRRTAATTRTTPAWSATSAWPGWRSIRSRT